MITESDSARTSMPAPATRAAVTVDAGVAGLLRSQVSSCRPRTSAIAAASDSVSGAGGSEVIMLSSTLPRVRAYQATLCTHPMSLSLGTVVQPSSRMAAPGATAAKSSLGQPGVPGSLASTTRIGQLLWYDLAGTALMLVPGASHRLVGGWRGSAPG